MPADVSPNNIMDVVIPYSQLQYRLMGNHGWIWLQESVTGVVIRHPLRAGKRSPRSTLFRPLVTSTRLLPRPLHANTDGMQLSGLWEWVDASCERLSL
jgi:hypothetical protein